MSMHGLPSVPRSTGSDNEVGPVAPSTVTVTWSKGGFVSDALPGDTAHSSGWSYRAGGCGTRGSIGCGSKRDPEHIRSSACRNYHIADWAKRATPGTQTA